MKHLLEAYGIYDLRKIARAVGIHSPTTLKREELIRLIREKIESGQVKDNANPQRIGRPPKITTDISIDKLALITKLNDLKDYVLKIIECMEDIEKTINDLENHDSNTRV